MSRSLILILGDQLSPSMSSLKQGDKAGDVVLMAEVMAEASYVPHHKKKIAFIFSAMRHFAQELRSAGWTVDYVKERKAFGKSISQFQNTKFVLAEQRTEVDVAQAFVDQCILALNEGTLTAPQAAQAKYWCTELQKRVADKCLQLFGGYGYMTEYPIARAYADARVTSIYGGTTEVMKSIIAKDMDL